MLIAVPLILVQEWKPRSRNLPRTKRRRGGKKTKFLRISILLAHQFNFSNTSKFLLLSSGLRWRRETERSGQNWGSGQRLIRVFFSIYFNFLTLKMCREAAEVSGRAGVAPHLLSDVGWLTCKCLQVLLAALSLLCVTGSAHDSSWFLSLSFSSFFFRGTLSFLTPPSLSSSSHYSMSPPFLLQCPPHNATPPPPDSALPFLRFPLGRGAKVGRQTEAIASLGRAEGEPKAGELIMCVFVFWSVLALFLYASVPKLDSALVTRSCK